MQSSWWGRESWLLCLNCLPGVWWWLSGSSSRCHGVVCGLWLWYFLIILTYYSGQCMGKWQKQKKTSQTRKLRRQPFSNRCHQDCEKWLRHIANFVCFVWFDYLRPINNLSVVKGPVFLDWTSTKLGLIICSRIQLSDAGETRTCGPSVSSRALYHWATAPPQQITNKIHKRSTNLERSVRKYWGPKWHHLTLNSNAYHIHVWLAWKILTYQWPISRG